MDSHGLGLVVIRALRVCPFGPGRIRMEYLVGEDGALGIRRGIVEHPPVGLELAGIMGSRSGRETLVRVLVVCSVSRVAVMAI